MSAVGSLAAITWTRTLRGNALWVAIGMGALPLMVAMLMVVMPRMAQQDVLFLMIRFLIAILPAMFVGASLGEEIETKTAAYLWSRPIPRWAVLAGKLATLVPFAAAIVVASWVASMTLTSNHLPSLTSCIGVIFGVGAASVVAAAIASIWPAHGMAVTIAYLILVDLPIGALPSSIEEISVAHQIKTLAGMTDSSVLHGAVGLLVLTAAWGALALHRIRRLEV